MPSSMRRGRAPAALRRRQGPDRADEPADHHAEGSRPTFGSIPIDSDGVATISRGPPANQRPRDAER